MKRYFIYNVGDNFVKTAIVHLSDEGYNGVKEVFKELDCYGNDHTIEEIPKDEEVIETFKNYLISKSIDPQSIKCCGETNKRNIISDFVRETYKGNSYEYKKYCIN